MLLSKRSPASALPLTAAALWNAAGLKSLQALKVLLLCPRKLQDCLAEISSNHPCLCPSRATLEYVHISRRVVLPPLWEPPFSGQPCTLHGLHVLWRWEQSQVFGTPPDHLCKAQPCWPCSLAVTFNRRTTTWGSSQEKPSLPWLNFSSLPGPTDVLCSVLSLASSSTEKTQSNKNE